jgi:hypothetical protein
VTKHEEAGALETFTDRHRKMLGTLVAKYGREAVAAAANSIETPQRGRPPQWPPGPGYLRVAHLADWLDDRKEEYEEQGSKHPALDAMFALREMLDYEEELPEGEDNADDTDDLSIDADIDELSDYEVSEADRKFLVTIKRKWTRGRRHNEEMKQSAAQINRVTSKAGGG